MTIQSPNLAGLYQELDWLAEVINQVIASYLKHEGHENHWLDIPPPDLTESETVYAQLMCNWQCNVYERLTLALAMAPHLKPEVLDIFFDRNQIFDRGFSEFGGVADKVFGVFLPTGKTLAFLISANDPERHFDVMNILSLKHKFAVEQVISLEISDHKLPTLDGVLTLSDQWLHYFMTGEKIKPDIHN